MAGPEQPNEPLVLVLRQVIRLAVRALALLMTVVILFGVADVVYVLYGRLMAEPRWILQITDILATFGTFMAVLIAIEIFVNVVLYLRDDVIHVKMVMATALMAIARKVIILDLDQLTADKVWATAAVVLATSAGYWIVHRYTPSSREPSDRHL